MNFSIIIPTFNRAALRPDERRNAFAAPPISRHISKLSFIRRSGDDTCHLGDAAQLWRGRQTYVSELQTANL
jgi:hypothetical protein